MDLDKKLRIITRSATEKKALDIVVLSVGGISSIAEYFFICSGQNVRQTKTIADTIEEELSRRDSKPMHVEGKAGGRWVLMDYGDVIVNVFLPETREFFDLERLWGDAEQIQVDDLLSEVV